MAAALLCLSGEARAENFFELLFGVKPARPVPPQMVPSAPAPAQGMPEGAPGEGGAPRAVAPAAPVQARPVAAKPVTEDMALGRDLKLNGAAGSLRLERAGQGLKARLALAGSVVGKPGEACTVTLGDAEPLTLAAQGRPDGLPRYELDHPACRMTVDVLDGAVLVKGPEMCTFEAASCQADLRGLWGPEPGALLTQAKAIEQERGQADKAVRENYKTLTQRAKPNEVRPIVSEQAAFSSEREQLCRSYAREGAHGFCNARFTEARVAALAVKLGIAPADKPEQTARPRRPRPPAQVSQTLSPAAEQTGATEAQ